MGMDAELFAIGRFLPELAPYLEYPEQYYNNTPIGSTIITSVVTCVTSEGSRILADALGISPWSFEGHCDLSGEGADLEGLLEAGRDLGEVKAFEVLRDHGFKFYYLPNG